MTTKRLMKALLEGKELICKWEMRGNEPVEPIYAKLISCGEVSFRHKDASYLTDSFGVTFPQFYPFTRITARDWKVVPEVKEKQWYENVPVLRVDCDGFIVFTKEMLCQITIAFEVGVQSPLVLVSGYKLYDNETKVRFSSGNNVLPVNATIIPLYKEQLPNYLSNFTIRDNIK
jgi:hypothetical protein